MIFLSPSVTSSSDTSNSLRRLFKGTAKLQPFPQYTPQPEHQSRCRPAHYLLARPHPLFPGGYWLTCEGQKVAVSLPIQKAPPLALTDWRWIGLKERAAMIVNGEGTVDSWREERGDARLRVPRKARRTAVMVGFILFVDAVANVESMLKKDGVCM